MEAVVVRVSRAEGTVAEVRASGEGAVAVVDFTAANEPDVKVAGMTELVFTGGELQSPLQVSARVLARLHDGNTHRCEFLVDRETQNHLLPQNSRRQALRVRPSAELPLDATITVPGHDGEAFVMVEDVSITGISAFVTREDETQLAPHWNFVLDLELPGETAAARFPVNIRQRRLKGSAIVHGMQFDQDATEHFARMQERIQTYIMQGQREMLQLRKAG